MKTIIAGSRTIQSYDLVRRAIEDSGFSDQITTVFSGMSSGPDIFGFRWATERKIPIRQFKPEWDKLGKQAGYIRNAEMCTFADAIIAVWDGRSNGTAHIIKYSLQMDPPLRRYVVNVGPQLQTLQDYGRQQII